MRYLKTFEKVTEKHDFQKYDLLTWRRPSDYATFYYIYLRDSEPFGPFKNIIETIFLGLGSTGTDGGIMMTFKRYQPSKEDLNLDRLEIKKISEIDRYIFFNDINLEERIDFIKKKENFDFRKTIEYKKAKAKEFNL